MSYLKDSIRHTCRVMERMIVRGDVDLYAETLLQLIRDIYTLRKGSFPQASIREVIALIGIELNESELVLMEQLEKSSRNYKDFREFIDTIDIRRLVKIFRQVKAAVFSAIVLVAVAFLFSIV